MQDFERKTQGEGRYREKRALYPRKFQEVMQSRVLVGLKSLLADSVPLWTCFSNPAFVRGGLPIG